MAKLQVIIAGPLFAELMHPISLLKMAYAKKLAKEACMANGVMLKL
jgi:hypothetical protein